MTAAIRLAHGAKYPYDARPMHGGTGTRNFNDLKPSDPENGV